MVGKLTPNNIISASRIPVLLGLSPYSTPNEMLSEMRALDAGSPKPSTFHGNEATHWGDTLEPVILKQACQRLGIIEADLDLTEAFFHHELPLAASLDGMGNFTGTIKHDPSKGIYCIGADEIEVDGWGALEAKLTSARPEDQPPAHRGVYQLQAQMLCAGFEWGAIATLYQGIELRVFVYQADPYRQGRIIDAVRDFEERRKTGDKYPVLSSDDGNAAFNKVDDGAPPIDLTKTQGGQQLALQLSEAKDRKRQAEWDIDQIEASIKEIMGEHDEAFTEIAGRKFIIKWPMRKTRAKPETVVPAKPETVTRQKTLTLKIIESD
jgi:predicted phage-related endonuclease